jgi:hypothetical protein
MNMDVGALFIVESNHTIKILTDKSEMDFEYPTVVCPMSESRKTTQTLTAAGTKQIRVRQLKKLMPLVATFYLFDPHTSYIVRTHHIP